MVHNKGTMVRTMSWTATTQSLGCYDRMETIQGHPDDDHCRFSYTQRAALGNDSAYITSDCANGMLDEMRSGRSDCVDDTSDCKLDMTSRENGGIYVITSDLKVIGGIWAATTDYADGMLDGGYQNQNPDLTPRGNTIIRSIQYSSFLCLTKQGPQECVEETMQMQQEYKRSYLNRIGQAWPNTWKMEEQRRNDGQGMAKMVSN
mmetsp:Transcript_5271/g.11461  ORF Transcript_5271/g.11461 Transcript_5271/m.11461 type:complete len:204 (+) Transcript_5271:125-736(+)